MFLVGAICFIILLLLELRIFEALFYWIRGGLRKCLRRQTVKTMNLPANERDEIDSDVKAEKERVDKMTPLEIQSNNLVLKSMTKIYDQFMAVNQLSVAVDQ